MGGSKMQQHIMPPMDAFKELQDAKLLALSLRIESLKQLVDERDRRYADRFTEQKVAVDAALTAQKELYFVVNESSKDAIIKAEASQKEVNVRSNEFRGQLSDQAARLMPRSETESIERGLRERWDSDMKQVRLDIAGLRESRSEGHGDKAGSLPRSWVCLL
jgi:hypothetical protein